MVGVLVPSHQYSTTLLYPNFLHFLLVGGVLVTGTTVVPPLYTSTTSSTIWVSYWINFFLNFELNGGGWVLKWVNSKYLNRRKLKALLNFLLLAVVGWSKKLGKESQWWFLWLASSRTPSQKCFPPPPPPPPLLPFLFIAAVAVYVCERESECWCVRITNFLSPPPSSLLLLQLLFVAVALPLIIPFLSSNFPAIFFSSLPCFASSSSSSTFALLHFACKG